MNARRVLFSGNYLLGSEWPKSGLLRSDPDHWANVAVYSKSGWFGFRGGRVL